MSLLGRLVRFFERPEVVKWNILSFVCIISGLGRTLSKYERTYGPPKGQTNGEPPSGGVGPMDWRRFPKQASWVARLKLFSALYMLYVVVKYTLSKQIELLVRQFVHLERPIHCYLMGRDILVDSLADFTAALFSTTTMIWRLISTVVKPYRMNLLYFLWQSEHDRELVYARLESAQGLVLAQGQHYEQFTRPERFLLDTLCYRVVYPDQVVFRLRANRTREAHLKLRQLMARMTLVWFLFFGPIALTANIALPIVVPLDGRYLRAYPNCDNQLEERKSSGWSVTLSRHHLATIAFDLVENFIVWNEIGLLMGFVWLVIGLFSYDLQLQWTEIEHKIKNLARLAASRQQVSGGAERAARDLQAYELVAEINDFFDQIHQASGFLTPFLNFGLASLLGICATYACLMQTDSVGLLPLPLVGILLIVATYLVLGCYTYVTIHLKCAKSYTRLCSLMAHDATNYDTNYGAIIDCYLQRRDCFLLMSQFRFLPRTFLTCIGWKFSLFCIITEMVQRGRWRGRGLG